VGHVTRYVVHLEVKGVNDEAASYFPVTLLYCRTRYAEIRTFEQSCHRQCVLGRMVGWSLTLN
jgi:hypothetical protein